MAEGTSFENELDCVSVVSQDEGENDLRKGVLQNEDLLPFILVHLKDVLQDEALRNGEEGSGASGDGKAGEDGDSDTSQSWRNDFASLILVNMSFFRAGTAILWENMENLSPVFGLLPWFKREYRGVRVSGLTSFFRISRAHGIYFLRPSALHPPRAGSDSIFTRPSFKALF
jgi:hypothetical protein